MSATLTTAPLPLFRPDAGEPLRPRRLTLEERLERSFAELKSGATTECPLCHAPMRPTADGGECGGCGSQLS
jgi:hypothetical protein